MAKKVFIAGYYGAGNAGDEAILAVMFGELRRHVPDLHAVVVSWDPASTSSAYGVESVLNTDRPGLIAAVRGCDFVILGGGGLLHDYWDVSLAGSSYYFLGALAALYAKPLILFAIGVGPLSTRMGRVYTQMVAELAQVITVRDEQSKILLGELGVDAARVRVTADPAFLFTYPLATLELPRPAVGVALRNWSIGVDSGIWEAEVAGALDGFLDRHGGSVLLLPFQRSAIDDDGAVAERVRARMRHQSTVLFEAAGEARELAGAIGRCDLMLGMRYHSVLFAIRRGIPTVGLIYDPKVRNLLAEADCEGYAVDLGAVRADNLLERLERAFADASVPGKMVSFSDRMSQAASENIKQVAGFLTQDVAHLPAPSIRRWWWDELAGAGFGLQASIAERRLEWGRDWPYDIVCFPGIEWDFRWMRAQQLMSQFAERGHRVFFVSVEKFLPQDGKKFVTRAVRRNVWEVQLAVPSAVDVYSGSLPDEVRDALVDDIAALAGAFAIDCAACVLHLPAWSHAVYQLRSRFGWPIVYDCMDDWSGFAWIPDAMLEQEARLVADCDLVAVSAQRLWGKWSTGNRNTVLIRNAADPAHYRREAGKLPVEMPVSGRVVGYFGAIDSWFDVELVHHAASARPQYFFALIGDIHDSRVDLLRGLPNVHFFGHQRYDLLPAFLRRFDACIIPFKLNTVTQSTDPVKFYEYIAQGKPVVSTRLPELAAYREVAYLADSADDFVRLLDLAVGERDAELRERRMALARENSWAARCQLFDEAIERAISAGRHPRILFAYQTLSLGGVEIVLKSRVAELRRRGYSTCLVFMEEIDGRALFEDSGFAVRVCPGEPELADALSSFKPDWIVSIDTPVVLEVGQRTVPEAGLVYEVHSSYARMLAPLTDRDLLSGVRGVLVPSESQRNRIRPLLAVDKPVEVVPNALAPGFLEADGGLEAAARPVILWVGRLDSLKGWRAFLEIASRLRETTHAEFLLVSAGFSGEVEIELQDAIKSFEVEGRLRQMRAVEHSRMPAIYQAAAQSGGCLVSTSANESFGMAVLEAMACGCPVVVPDVVGLQDLVRHGQTGRRYPEGNLSAACEECIETLNQPPEERRIITKAAAEFARSFSPAGAVDRFLAALAEWSRPQAALTPSQALSRILATAPTETNIVIFPPGMPWGVAAVSNRARRWAQAFARRGCLVFYCDSQHVSAGGNEFTEVENRILVANVPLEVFAGIQEPRVVADSSNLEQLGHFCDARVLYECRDGSSEPDLHTEWLARATVVTVSSEILRDSIASHRPDAILAPEAEPFPDDVVSLILKRLSDGRAEQKPVRLKALLAWRERQIGVLSRQIRERDRPAVEILRDAVKEQKYILAARDKGIAFLRGEVAARDKIITERNQTVKFLGDAIVHRDATLALLRKEIEARDGIIQSRQNAVAFLEEEVSAQRAATTFLREELAQREMVISKREQAIKFLQQEVAARSEETIFLRGELAQREKIVSEREKAIEFLQQEVAARDLSVAAQQEGIAFLRNELAQLERAVAERESKLLESEAVLADLRQTLREIDARVGSKAAAPIEARGSQ